MALRMTEEEFREWQRNREYKPQKTSYGSIAGAAPACRQSAKPGGVTLEDEDGLQYHTTGPNIDLGICAAEKPESPFDRMHRRVSKYAAAQVMAERGYPGAEIVLPDEKKKRQKYGNKRVEVNGLKFDSQHEATVYQELMARVRDGELKCVCRQVRFDLGEGYHATKESRYSYIADFVTIDRDGRVNVIDAKSEITRKNRTYINKKKQMQAEWGLEIREV